VGQARGESAEEGRLRVRLTRKLAQCLDGIDLRRHRQGDIIDLPRAQAELLIAEAWAQPLAGDRRRRNQPAWHEFAVAADQEVHHPTRTVEQLRRVRQQMDRQRFELEERRRIEDRIREELHDARARTISRRER
jgi:hypothetical protein